MTKRESVYKVCKCIWWAVKVGIVSTAIALVWFALGYFLVALGEISSTALVTFLALLVYVVIGFLVASKLHHH